MKDQRCGLCLASKMFNCQLGNGAISLLSAAMSHPVVTILPSLPHPQGHDAIRELVAHACLARELALAEKYRRGKKAGKGAAAVGPQEGQPILQGRVGPRAAATRRCLLSASAQYTQPRWGRM